MDKRAQGLPITTVILAILGIIVLVILFAIMTGRLTIFAGAASECPGVCLSDINTMNTKSVQPANGVIEARSDCTDVTEKRLYGNYIARGVRDKDNKAVVCSACCQQLA